MDSLIDLKGGSLSVWKIRWIFLALGIIIFSIMTSNGQNTAKQAGEIDLISGTFVKAGLEPGPEHKQLEPLIGRWINEGETIATAGAPSVRIVASDVFEWTPGGFFVLHYAYGRAGDFGGGAVEIIGYDEASRKYRNFTFDSSGILTQEEGIFKDGKWIFGGVNTRFTGTIAGNGNTITGKHERLIDGKWTHVMNITLKKVK